ncbi:MAG: polysaccharide deacetylase [Aquificae bacterium]|nr:polysaccharide deacetylase [Aquificota bacterium]
MRFTIVLTWFAISLLFAKPECVMFLYDRKPLPDYFLQAYDWVVLPPENETPAALKERSFYLKKKAKLLAYLSVGELRPEEKELFKELQRGGSERWGSAFVDFRSERYRSWLLKRAEELIKRGFEGFFLDTLDSYLAFAPESERGSYEEALVELIKSLRKRFPEAVIVINRGFEVLERVAPFVDAVAAESLFYGLEGEVPKEDRRWLISQLKRAKRLGLEVIVIDYLPAEEYEKRREVARRIRKLGFIPYVADPELSEPGYSCELIPRRLLIVYEPEDLPMYLVAHTLFQLPVEHLGFIPELVPSNELPSVSRDAGYAGVLIVNLPNKDERFERWVFSVVKRGVKVFFAGSVPLSFKALKKLGLEVIEKPGRPEGVELKLPVFEAPFVPREREFGLMPKEGRPLVLVKTRKAVYAPLAITPWGGYAQEGALFNDEDLWVFEPFTLFNEVFGPLPFAPDPTTEGGRRVLTVHVDGDGFNQRSEVRPGAYAAEVIRDEILKVYRLPHTVSVIEGEIAPWGLKPEEAPRLERIARSIFALPHVEPASHSFSHPFTWNPDDPHAQYLPYGYNLPIKGYRLDYRREIEGSLKYVSGRLAEGKARAFLWTGYCNPVKWQVRLTYQLGVFNVNGGNTTITRAEPFLRNVSPLGINHGQYFHVYAPVQNENVFTNNWTYPIWGYATVIQTFELTEKPRRLKPVAIYYHFFSGSRFASLNALKRVYAWAMKKPLTPLYLTEYAAAVLDFRGTAFVKKEGRIEVRNSGHLRTLRVPVSAGYPDLINSKGVAGFNEHDGYYYLILDGSGYYEIAFSEHEPPYYLKSVNGRVVSVKKTEDGMLFELEARVPIEAEFVLPAGCRLYFNGRPVKAKVKTGVKRGAFKVSCSY